MKSLSYQLRKSIRHRVSGRALARYRKFRSCYRKVSDGWFKHTQARHYRKMISSRFPDIEFKRSSGLVLDLGANLGHFTDACSSLGFSVVSVEPHPSAFQYLSSRFAKYPNVQLIRRAITQKENRVFLQLHPDHSNDPLTTSLTASIIREKFTAPHERVEVEGMPFSKLFEQNEFYEIVKIDIEGAELFLIEDLIKFAPNIHRLLLETHSRFMQTSLHGDLYHEKITLLEEFISLNNLEGKWFTDWI
jgi:FkbM family methyltransferase